MCGCSFVVLRTREQRAWVGSFRLRVLRKQGLDIAAHGPPANDGVVYQARIKLFRRRVQMGAGFLGQCRFRQLGEHDSRGQRYPLAEGDGFAHAE